jgi:hypothetical protein
MMGGGFYPLPFKENKDDDKKAEEPSGSTDRPRPYLRDLMSPAEKRLEQYATNGLIDRMLNLRVFPDPASLMSDDVVVVWQNAIDASLDLIVPAMKTLAMAPAETNHGPNCISKQLVTQAIGNVPLSRGAGGWK